MVISKKEKIILAICVVAIISVLVVFFVAMPIEVNKIMNTDYAAEYLKSQGQDPSILHR